MPQAFLEDIREAFPEIHKTILKETIKQADPDNELLSTTVDRIFYSYKFISIQNIAPFFSKIGERVMDTSGRDDGAVLIFDIENFIDEILNDLNQAVYEDACLFFKKD